MNLAKGILGITLAIPMLLLACSGASPGEENENIASDDEALKAAPGCQPPPVGGSCIGHGIALPNGTCGGKLDLYAKAEATCKGSGQTLRDFAVLGLCPGGGATGAKFQCCDEVTPPPPPPPPPPPRKCFGGGWAADYPAGGKCADPGTLASQVEAICKKQGYVVNSFSVGNECKAGGYDGAKYECCEPKDPPPPPPPPRKCFSGGFASGSTPGGSLSCTDGKTLASQVTAICAQAGYDVNTYIAGAPCPGGGFNGASYECCEPKDRVPTPPTPVPPTPPPTPVPPKG